MSDIVAELQKKDTIDSFKNKKLESLKLAPLYSYNQSKSIKINDCSVTLWRETWQHIDTNEQKQLYSSNRCNLRFCPVCSWRKALKSSAILYTNLSNIQNVNFLFLTLTLKNCDISELKNTIKHMSQSFARLRKKEKWKKVVKGFIRALEITVSDDGKMHPHYHVLLQVSPSYSKNKGYYLSQSELTELWRSSLQVDYKPIIDIRHIRPKNDLQNSLISAVCETVKYTLKSSDILKLDKYSFPILDKAMKGVKTINCGGSLLYALTLDDDDKLSQDEWILLGRELFKWVNGDYSLMEGSY